MNSLYLEVKEGRERRRQAKLTARRERAQKRKIERRVSILRAVNKFLHAIGL